MAINKDNSIFYVHNDHLNTPRKVTNTHNVVVFDWPAVDPFGANQPTINTIGFNIRYPGQYYDTETAYHYNYHRYYNPKTGKYLQADPIGLDGGYNLYNYVNNNSLVRVDPEGLDDLYLGDEMSNKDYPINAAFRKSNSHRDTLVVFGHSNPDFITLAARTNLKVNPDWEYNVPKNFNQKGKTREQIIKEANANAIGFYELNAKQFLELLTLNNIDVSQYSYIEFRTCHLASGEIPQEIANITGKKVLASPTWYNFSISQGSVGVNYIPIITPTITSGRMIQFLPNN